MQFYVLNFDTKSCLISLTLPSYYLRQKSRPSIINLKLGGPEDMSRCGVYHPVAGPGTD
jgi:hypothetical protein